MPDWRPLRDIYIAQVFAIAEGWERNTPAGFMCRVDGSHVEGEYSRRRANQHRRLAEATIYHIPMVQNTRRWTMDNRTAGIGAKDPLALLHTGLLFCRFSLSH